METLISVGLIWLKQKSFFFADISPYHKHDDGFNAAWELQPQLIVSIMTAETAQWAADTRRGVVRHYQQSTIHSAGIMLHTHTPARSNLTFILGDGANEVGTGWWEGKQNISSEIP